MTNVSYEATLYLVIYGVWYADCESFVSRYSCKEIEH